MAIDCGIIMEKSRLHKEGGRCHFMIKRFDRTDVGKKLHMQSLGATAHFDYLQASSYSYERAIQVAKKLKLSQNDLSQLVLRRFYNVVFRNQDDQCTKLLSNFSLKVTR